MQLEMMILSKSGRERQISYIVYMRRLNKTVQMNLFTKQNTVTDVENKHDCGVMQKKGGINWRLRLAYTHHYIWGFPSGSVVKNPPVMKKM